MRPLPRKKTKPFPKETLEMLLTAEIINCSISSDVEDLGEEEFDSQDESYKYVIIRMI